ncbi:MAG: primosomal protein N', partial [Cyclobacteriaceae bacterium]
MEKTVFVDVILPVPIARRFTYRLPRDMNVEPGMRVAVPFGKRRVLTGIADRIHDQPPSKYEARYIYEVLDTTLVMFPLQIRFLDWMAEYYMTTPGEVLNAALPAGLKISSDSYVQLHPTASGEDFDEEFQALYYALSENESLKYQQVEEILGERNAFKSLQYLAHKGLVILYDEIRERYTPRREKYISLAAEYRQDDKLNNIFDSLSRAPKQEEALLIFLQHMRSPGDPGKRDYRIQKSDLSKAGAASHALQQLIKKGIFTETEEIVSRFPELGTTAKEIQLSEVQEKAFDEIATGFETH